MAQIIDNRSRITGTVLHLEPQPEQPGFVRLTLRVATVEAVPGFAELLTAQQLPRVQVLAPAASLPADLPGRRVALTVRMAPLARLFLQNDVPVEVLP